MNKEYQFFGWCRQLQDDEIVSWLDLEDMKKISSKISLETFSRKTNFVSDDETSCYILDPSFGCFKSILQGKNVLYWQYAGFEYIYMENKES
jgi:hypothetical protein